jgi:transcriptional regulator with XRE-family HTH domain
MIAFSAILWHDRVIKQGGAFMEQTLGKRIAKNRKKLNLTQDQLAEKLGVTAQAVSKWENDQSCPDISMLPRLAELFGISIDELMGHTAPAHAAEVVYDTEDDAIHVQKGNWEFKWDSGRSGAIGFACWVLLMGMLLLVEAITQTDIGLWSLAWPSALIMIGLFGGKKFSFFRLGCILLGSWFLLEKVGLIPMELDNSIIWPVLVLLFGISLLADALRKPKKPHFTITRGGEKLTDKEVVSTYEVDGDDFECNLTFGDRTQLVELPLLSHGDISVSCGELTVDLSGCGMIAPDCSIDASCSFGQLNLLIPRKYLIEADSSTAFAAYEVKGHPDSSPEARIRLDASVSFGAITVQYI